MKNVGVQLTQSLSTYMNLVDSYIARQSVLMLILDYRSEIGARHLKIASRRYRLLLLLVLAKIYKNESKEVMGLCFILLLEVKGRAHSRK